MISEMRLAALVLALICGQASAEEPSDLDTEESGFSLPGPESTELPKYKDQRILDVEELPNRRCWRHIRIPLVVHLRRDFKAKLAESFLEM